MMIFLAALQGVPRDLEEAAAVDGAGRWRRFRTVTVPAIWPALTFVTVMLVIGGFNVFTSVLLMTGGGPADQTQVLLTFMYEQAFKYLQFGYGSAIAALLTVLVFILSVIQLRMFRNRENRDDADPGWLRPSRMGLAVRYVLLTVGAFVMVLPFLYMLSTSFKSQQYVLTTPPQWIPHPATASNYTGRGAPDHFPRYFLNSLARRLAHHGPVTPAELDDGVRLRPLRLSSAARLMFRILLAWPDDPGNDADHPAVHPGQVPGSARLAARPRRLLCRRHPGVEHVPAAWFLRGGAGRVRAGDGGRRSRLDHPLLAVDPSAGPARTGHGHDLYVPRHLGRVSVGADHHQFSVEIHAAAGYRVVSRARTPRCGDSSSPRRSPRSARSSWSS